MTNLPSSREVPRRYCAPSARGRAGAKRGVLAGTGAVSPACHRRQTPACVSPMVEEKSRHPGLQDPPLLLLVSKAAGPGSKGWTQGLDSEPVEKGGTRCQGWAGRPEEPCVLHLPWLSMGPSFRMGKMRWQGRAVSGILKPTPMLPFPCPEPVAGVLCGHGGLSFLLNHLRPWNPPQHSTSSSCLLRVPAGS